MKKTIATIIAIAALSVPTAALAETTEDISASCIDEVTGEAGLRQWDGDCITPAEYDAIFSPEALAEVESFSPEFETVAETLTVEEQAVPASERTLGRGVSSEPFTFKGLVAKKANGNIAL